MTGCWFLDEGMRLWYAVNGTAFVQLLFSRSSSVPGRYGWVYEQHWSNLNAHVSPACYTSGPDHVTYVMFVDLNDTVNFYW